MDEEPSAEVVRAWARLVRAQRVALGAIEAELKAAALPPLGWYDVLLEVSRAEGPLRPAVLERQLLLAQHNVSRLIDRMAAAGLVARGPCEDDGRGQVITLTPAGQEMQRRMWRVYAPAIQRHVGARLGEEAAATLSEALKRIIG